MSYQTQKKSAKELKNRYGSGERAHAHYTWNQKEVQSVGVHMATLSNLLGSNLSYIFGERESGSNGAKKEFLTKGAAFMRALGKG